MLKGRSKTCGCGERESRYTRKHSVDIAGKQYGHLTVLKDSGQRESNGTTIWICDCICGNKTTASYSDLKSGRVTSCGCKKVHANTKDITGQKFGLLTVLGIDRSRKRKKGDKLHWTCQCECGNITSVTTSDLTTGGTVSCGCTQGSFHEKYIARLLKEYHIDFIQQKKFSDCRLSRELPFDFYIPSINLAIEYDGRQHYDPVPHWGGEHSLEQTQKKDQIKNKYCEENNIKLIRLPYTMSCSEIKDTISTLKTRNE